VHDAQVGQCKTQFVYHIGECAGQKAVLAVEVLAHLQYEVRDLLPAYA